MGDQAEVTRWKGSLWLHALCQGHHATPKFNMLNTCRSRDSELRHNNIYTRFYTDILVNINWYANQRTLVAYVYEITCEYCRLACLIPMK